MKERVYHFRSAMFNLLFIDYVFVANYFIVYSQLERMDSARALPCRGENYAFG